MPPTPTIESTMKRITGANRFFAEFIKLSANKELNIIVTGTIGALKALHTQIEGKIYENVKIDIIDAYGSQLGLFQSYFFGNLDNEKDLIMGKNEVIKNAKLKEKLETKFDGLKKHLENKTSKASEASKGKSCSIPNLIPISSDIAKIIEYLNELGVEGNIFTLKRLRKDTGTSGAPPPAKGNGKGKGKARAVPQYEMEEECSRLSATKHPSLPGQNRDDMIQVFEIHNIYADNIAKLTGEQMANIKKIITEPYKGDKFDEYNRKHLEKQAEKNTSSKGQTPLNQAVDIDTSQMSEEEQVALALQLSMANQLQPHQLTEEEQMALVTQMSMNNQSVTDGQFNNTKFEADLELAIKLSKTKQPNTECVELSNFGITTLETCGDGDCFFHACGRILGQADETGRKALNVTGLRKEYFEKLKIYISKLPNDQVEAVVSGLNDMGFLDGGILKTYTEIAFDKSIINNQATKICGSMGDNLEKVKKIIQEYRTLLLKLVVIQTINIAHTSSDSYKDIVMIAKPRQFAGSLQFTPATHIQGGELAVQFFCYTYNLGALVFHKGSLRRFNPKNPGGNYCIFSNRGGSHFEACSYNGKLQIDQSQTETIKLAYIAKRCPVVGDEIDINYLTPIFSTSEVGSHRGGSHSHPHKTSKRKTSKRKTSNRKTSNRKTSKRKTSNKRSHKTQPVYKKTSKRKSSKKKSNKKKTSNKKSISSKRRNKRYTSKRRS